MGVREDADHKQGVYLQKNVVQVAEIALARHVRRVAPRILTVTQLVRLFIYHATSHLFYWCSCEMVHCIYEECSTAALLFELQYLVYLFIDPED